MLGGRREEEEQVVSVAPPFSGQIEIDPLFFLSLFHSISVLLFIPPSPMFHWVTTCDLNGVIFTNGRNVGASQ